jgi:hypothetical protein
LGFLGKKKTWWVATLISNSSSPSPIHGLVIVFCKQIQRIVDFCGSPTYLQGPQLIEAPAAYAAANPYPTPGFQHPGGFGGFGGGGVVQQAAYGGEGVQQAGGLGGAYGSGGYQHAAYAAAFGGGGFQKAFPGTPTNSGAASSSAGSSSSSSSSNSNKKVKQEKVEEEDGPQSPAEAEALYQLLQVL